MEIYRLTDDPVVTFAAAELRKFLSRMCDAPIELREADAYDAGWAGVWLGVAADFGGDVAARAALRADSPDDAVHIAADGGHVVLTGPNPRCVLFAVYRYLEALGCRWLHAGRDGERVPRVRDPLAQPVAIDTVASTRHRVICIEGSCSIEHVTDLIDYAAKRGFNAYFIQFRNAYTFFERWYGLEKNGNATKTPYTSDEAQVARDMVKAAALMRGMMLHVIGHGWTCEPFGIRGEQWKDTGQHVPDEVRPYLAQVNGKRELWGGIALNTNLCYSQPIVRQTMVDAIAAYAKTNPDEDIIHVWLADGSNNQCECDACAAKLPSDWYVVLLNELDAELSKRKLATRIVFLAYVDLLWAPREQRIANTDRFILMFAPITRSYTHALTDEPADAEQPVPPYVRNKLTFPTSPRTNLRMLDGWRAAFAGDCVDFDYHLWRDHIHDPGQVQLARVLFTDARDMASLGMNGFISCQVQRVAFPTGLYQHLLGCALWDADASYDALVDAYFKDVFGDDGLVVRQYLEGVSELFDPPFLRREKLDDASRAAAIDRWARVAAHVEAFTATIDAGCEASDAVMRAAWRIMRHHAWYVRAMAEVYAAAYRGDHVAGELYCALDRELDARLDELHHVLDTYMAKGMIQHMLHLEGIPHDDRIVPAGA